MHASPGILGPHHLKIVLMQPQIAPNTGNIARLCVTTGTELHLVRPMGFVLSDRYLKRSAMDYWARLKLTVHDDADTFLQHATDRSGRRWCFTTKGSRDLWDADFAPHDWLIFGSEASGLPDRILHHHPDRCVRIPQVPDERCLNLATAAGIGLYEALRQARLATCD